VREVTNRFVIENPTISMSIDAQPELYGVWDRLRIDQAVTNLVSNAIKYGMERPVEVSVSATPAHAIVTVEDHGRGIPRDDIERIFERFERLDAGSDDQRRRTQNEGLGMGLWITKQIVQAHDGTILVESELGKGSRFVVHLPLHLE
jgi:signal transduction histidine kinase